MFPVLIICIYILNFSYLTFLQHFLVFSVNSQTLFYFIIKAKCKEGKILLIFYFRDEATEWGKMLHSQLQNSVETTGNEHRCLDFQPKILFSTYLINHFKWYFILSFLCSFPEEYSKGKTSQYSAIFRVLFKLKFSKSRGVNVTFRMTRVILSFSFDFWLVLVYRELILFVNFFSVILNPNVYPNCKFFNYFSCHCVYSDS